MNILLSLTILGSIVALILIGFKSVFIHRYGGSWYYYIWILALISFCFPYKLDIFQYIQLNTNKMGQAINIYPVMNTDKFILSITEQNNQLLQQGGMVSESIFKVISIEKTLWVLYFIGIIAFSIYYSFLFLTFIKKINNNTKIVTNVQYLKCLRDTCLDMGISKNIILKEGPLIGSPMFMGIIKPTIILPVKKFEIVDLTLIFKHELTHYKRHDMAYRLLSLIVHIIHWFNPISLLAIHTINEACEYSCDEVVTKSMDEESKIKYGYMLLNQIQSNCRNDLFLFVPLKQNNKKNIIKRRLKIIMNTKKYKRSCITVCAILSLIICSNFFSLQSIKGEILKDNPLKSTVEGINTQSNMKDNFVTDDSTTISKYFAKIVTQDELMTIYDFVDNSENSIDVVTRSLMSSEENRLDILKEKFLYDNLRPNKMLPLSKGNYDFYFDINNEIYHYPERELTDEELLQLIEWRLKVNYALSLRNAQSQPSTHAESDMSQSEAIDLARNYVEKLFGVSTTNFRMDASLNQESTIQPDGWFIRLSPDKSNNNYTSDWNYAVWINSSTEVEISRSSPTYQSSLINDSDVDIYTQDISWMEIAESIAVKLQKEPSKIKATYYVNALDINEKRTVDIKVDMENETSYIVSLYYPDKILKGVVLSGQ